MRDRLPFVRGHPYTALPVVWGVLAVMLWWFFWPWQAALLWWVFVAGSGVVFRWWDDRDRADQQG